MTKHNISLPILIPCLTVGAIVLLAITSDYQGKIELEASPTGFRVLVQGKTQQ